MGNITYVGKYGLKCRLIKPSQRSNVRGRKVIKPKKGNRLSTLAWRGTDVRTGTVASMKSSILEAHTVLNVPVRVAPDNYPQYLRPLSLGQRTWPPWTLPIWPPAYNFEHCKDYKYT